jgi:hypothetical protein
MIHFCNKHFITCHVIYLPGLGKATKEIKDLPHLHKEYLNTQEALQDLPDKTLSDSLFGGHITRQTSAERAAAQRARQEEMEQEYEIERAQEREMMHTQVRED